MNLRRLRRRVRRDHRLTKGARLLFEDICDLHEDQGCFARDEWLAVQHDTTARTVRSWRAELRDAGVLEEEKRDGRRYLIPCQPDDEKRSNSEPQPESGSQLPKSASGAEANFRNELPDRKSASGSQLPAHRYNNTSLREEPEGERARVRQILLDEIGTDFPGQQLTRDELSQIVARAGPRGLEVLRGVCQEFERRDWSPNLPTIIKRTKRQLESLDDDGKSQADQGSSAAPGVPAGREGGQWGEYAERRA